MKKYWKILSAVLLLSTTTTTFSLAASSNPTPDPKGWHFEIMPYLWYAGMEGTVKVRGQEVDFEKSASDLFEAVEGGGSLLAVVQHDRFLFWGQVDSFSLSTGELDTKDQPEKGTLDTDLLIAEGAVGYQINGWSEGQTFDLLVGARSTNLDINLKLKNGQKFENEKNSLDPMLIVRPSFPLFKSKTNKLRFNPVLGVGGGGDAEVVYELFPQIQYHFTDNLVGRFGYRTVGWKFEDEKNNELDIRLAGLILGLGGTF
jgi:hypothetical protein